jgi:hypothetical protein
MRALQILLLSAAAGYGAILSFFTTPIARHGIKVRQWAERRLTSLR